MPEKLPHQVVQRIQKMALASIAISTLLACTAANAFDLKGLVLGETTTPATVEARLARCTPTPEKPCSRMDQLGSVSCGLGSMGRTICNGIATVAGSPGKVNVVLDANNVLQRILITELASYSYDDIGGELKAKFGKPTSQGRSRVQNGFGAQFEQTELVWRNAKGHMIEFDRYSGTVDDSRLYFSTREDREVLNGSTPKKGDL